MDPGTTLGVYLKAISSSAWLLLLLLLHFHGGIITGASAAFPYSSSEKTEQKCDKVVLVETPELLSYLGNVTFTVPTSFSGRWTTIIKFTSPFTFIGGWGVEVQSFGRKGYAVFVQSEDAVLQAGDQVIFQFRVLYGLNAKVPKVLSIRWQNLSICGPPIARINELQVVKTKSPYWGQEEGDEDSSGSASSSSSTSSEESAEVREHVITNNVRLVSSA